MVSFPMTLSDPWPGFQASRGFVSYSWAFLFINVYTMSFLQSFFYKVTIYLHKLEREWP